MSADWPDYDRDPLDELSKEERVGFLRAAEAMGAFQPHRLLLRWARLAESESAGVYPHMLEEYENDLDGRRAIEDILDRLPDGAQPTLRALLGEFDGTFRAHTVALDHAIWGYDVAPSDPEKYFFYFRLPRSPGYEMRNGLSSLGHADDLEYVLAQSTDGAR